MKKLLLALGAGVLMSVAASATTVTYSTTSSQLCVGSGSCGVNFQEIGGGTGVRVAFSPLASSTVDANPITFGSFGSVDISCVAGGTACGNQSLAGLVLTITITQTVPSAGSGSITSGNITGTISGTASNAVITWAGIPAVTIGQIRYSVVNNPLALVPPTTNNGITSIQAQITDQTIPEPSTYLLISGSLLGLGLMRKRLKK
ncbi:hypothetical protein F183_A13970 [Bryobacterales bacterium F-183]|nr:hypothetical protein F183_A13970 [Bryobacterales bacterium F-183]